MTQLILPPLMSSEQATTDPAELACLRAVQGCDAGLICYRISSDRIEAALVLAPDVPLAQAMTMLPLCGVGFQNALGALAPPEVAVHLGWDGAVFVNGARAGHITTFAATDDPTALPDWLIVSLTLRLTLDADEPGLTPQDTALFEEGCVDVDPTLLIEAWARHTLNWIQRWEDDGPKALHAEWRGLVRDMGEEITQSGLTGTFVGTDETWGMLLRDADTTHLIPLTQLLKDAP